MAKNSTIYQNLNDYLNIASQNTDINKTGNKIIIKGTSPEDVKRKGQELHQQQELRDKFFKTTDKGYFKALQYEAARLPAYMDYEGMEYYPLIASALDLIMEEATTVGGNGKMLNIYSPKERIKRDLEQLFYDIVNINVNLPFWTRNTCKYGNNFINIFGKKGSGITNVKQLVNYDIERIEKVINDRLSIKFKERESGDQFNIFEIIHFRLLGDDKMIPYGTSILSKARRVFRQCIMAEDAMLTYRIIRAGEKRIYKIDVGNIDEDDIEQYMYKVATKFKKEQQVDPNSGQIDYRFNILNNDEDIFLPVRNGNSQTGIDTLPGAQNLNDINDIEYLRGNLFTALGIPKPFLGFQNAAGDGKNMAQLDVRFSKKINRIQQAMIQELNKMAIIHLFLLGYDQEELNNFTLSLTNPSTQEEQLKTELLQTKAQVYSELTRNEGGIAAMSHTEAKRLLFNMSDSEIINDFKKQKMERAVAQELQDSPLKIRETGIFKDIDAKYGTNEIPETPQEEGGEEEGAMETNSELPNQSPSELPPVEGESIKSRKSMTDEEFDNTINKIVSTEKEKEVKGKNNQEIIMENNHRKKKLSETTKNLLDDIDKLDKRSTINKKRK